MLKIYTNATHMFALDKVSGCWFPEGGVSHLMVTAQMCSRSEHTGKSNVGDTSSLFLIKVTVEEHFMLYITKVRF